MITRLEYVDSAFNHYKFWEAELPDESTTLITRWGRIGTAGTSKSFSFASRYKALEEFHKKVALKLRKGYQQVAVSSPSPPPTHTIEETPKETTPTNGHRSLSQWMSL